MRIAFAFSDAAAAHACLAQAFTLKQEFNCKIVLLSNRQRHFPHWNFPVQYTDHVTESHLRDCDLLFTGTSHPESSDSFEVQAIRTAKTKNIYTIAFVDHWTLIRTRFESGGEIIFPNEVWVLDEIAKSTAIQEGVPEKIIRIHQNPFLLYLATYWKSAYAGKEYATEIGLPSDKKIVVIAPDPVSIRLQHVNPGFTEASALHDLLNALSELAKPLTIVLKAHPLQPMEVLHPILNQHSSLRVRVIKESNNPELIHLADLVIGFYSNFLLEAQAMNKPVLRYFPGNLKLDPLQHLTRIPPISNPSQALLSLQAIL